MISKKTKAMIIPNLIGNIPNLKTLKNLCKKYKLFFIEDSADTINDYYNNKPTGDYSDISTTSFIYMLLHVQDMAVCFALITKNFIKKL